MFNLFSYFSMYSKFKNEKFDIIHSHQPRSDFMVYRINKYVSKRSNIIELGCGNGEDAFYFYKSGHFVHTCDQSTNVLKIQK